MPSPSAFDFETAARKVLNRLPTAFREHLADVVLRIDEFASPEQLAAVGLENRWELTGLYEGIALPEQSQWDHERMPPVISLFRQPLLAEIQETGVGFADLVRHVVIHEAGHHFGLSDDDMHALEESVQD
ncbi:metallopeptidase family protein [Erythrobacter sp. NFXS35]|uniref:metallopeptidase family protein n=1 Tax=Erythrobacter sp. NFXS35 TaxID=2818436 RepID=UPI0032DE4443